MRFPSRPGVLQNGSPFWASVQSALYSAVVEPELGERLVERPVEPAAQSADPVDDSFDLEIEIGEDEVDGLEELVDVIALLGGAPIAPPV